jgi:hypothetical protein
MGGTEWRKGDFLIYIWRKGSVLSLNSGYLMGIQKNKENVGRSQDCFLLRLN